MKKIKAIFKDWFYHFMTQYQGKQFWPSLIKGLVCALVSGVLTAVVLPAAFSEKTVINQILSAFFLFMIMNGGIMAVTALIKKNKKAAIIYGALAGIFLVITVVMGIVNRDRVSDVDPAKPGVTAGAQNSGSHSDKNDDPYGKPAPGQPVPEKPEGESAGLVPVTDCDDDFVYTEKAPFAQPHTLSEFPADSGDDAGLFAGAGDDYLITGFKENQYTVWAFDEFGDICGIFAKDLKDGTANYIELSEDEVGEAAAHYTKYDFLRMAAAGSWTDYYYYFSKPYSVLDMDAARDEAGDNTGYTGENEGYSDEEPMYIEDIAYYLFTEMIKRAGDRDYEGFCDLFRNMDQASIDRYYNAEYKDVSRFDYHETFCTVMTDRYAYVTLLYYNRSLQDIPQLCDEYQVAAVLGWEDGTWKIESSAESMDAIRDLYELSIFTPDSYYNYQNGYPLFKYWVSFYVENGLVLPNVFTARVTEIGAVEGGIVVNLFLSNGLSYDVYAEKLADLYISDNGMPLCEVEMDWGLTIPSGRCLNYRLFIPEEYLEQPGLTNPQPEYLDIWYQ